MSNALDASLAYFNAWTGGDFEGPYATSRPTSCATPRTERSPASKP